MDAEGVLRVPPLAAELTFYWLPPESPMLGVTEFDEDGDPDCVGVSPIIYYSRTHARALVLHELTHCRAPHVGGKHGSGCEGGSRAWREEMRRLAGLGAPLL